MAKTREEKIFELTDLIEEYRDVLDYEVNYNKFDQVVSNKKQALINYDKEEGRFIKLIRQYIRQVINAGAVSALKVVNSSKKSYLEKGVSYDTFNNWNQSLGEKIPKIKRDMQNKLIVPVTASYGKGFERGMEDLGIDPRDTWVYMPGHAIPRLANLRLLNYIHSSVSEDMRIRLVEGLRRGENGRKIARDLRKLIKEPKKIIVPAKIDPRTGRILRRGYEYTISPRRYAEIIGRTEVSRATHMGRVDSYKQSGVVKDVIHITAGDRRVCPQCDMLDGTIYPIATASTKVPVHSMCFDIDTEVLTNEGWKYFKDLKGDEKIFSLNPKTFQPEFVSYKHYVKYYYEGKMYKFKSNILDKVVTPSHQMFIGRRTNNKYRKLRKYKLEECQKIKSFNDLVIPSSSKFKGKKQRYVMMGDKKIETHLFMRFLGWYMVEGNVSIRKKNSYQIGISQKNPLKVYEDIKDLPYKISIGKEKLFIFDVDLGKYLKKLGYSYQKYIPKELKDLDREYLESFLKTYNAGDGSISKNKNFGKYKSNYKRTYATSSKQLMSDVCELIIKCEKSVSVNENKCKGRLQKFRNGTYKLNHNVYIITECIHLNKHLNAAKISQIDYDNFVYDVELEKHHVLLVKRNGSIYWSGNCRCTIEANSYGEVTPEVKERYKVDTLDRVTNAAPLAAFGDQTIAQGIVRYERHLSARGFTSQGKLKQVYAKLERQLKDFAQVTGVTGFNKTNPNIRDLYLMHVIKNARIQAQRFLKEPIPPTFYKRINIIKGKRSITSSTTRAIDPRKNDAHITQLAELAFKDEVKTTRFARTLYHEMGHNIYCNPKRDANKLQREWKVLYDNKQLGFVSDYATIHTKEDFAESVGYFFTDTLKLKNSSPAKFKYLRKNVMGELI